MECGQICAVFHGRQVGAPRGCCGRTSTCGRELPVRYLFAGHSASRSITKDTVRAAFPIFDRRFVNSFHKPQRANPTHYFLFDIEQTIAPKSDLHSELNSSLSKITTHFLRAIPSPRPRFFSCSVDGVTESLRAAPQQKHAVLRMRFLELSPSSHRCSSQLRQLVRQRRTASKGASTSGDLDRSQSGPESGPEGSWRPHAAARLRAEVRCRISGRRLLRASGF